MLPCYKKTSKTVITYAPLNAEVNLLSFCRAIKKKALWNGTGSLI